MNDRGAAALAERLHAVHGPGSNCNDPETAAAILGERGVYLPDGLQAWHAVDQENARLRAALAATPEPDEPGLDAVTHKSGDPHHYQLTCKVCGENGTIRLTIDPETDIAARLSKEPTDAR